MTRHMLQRGGHEVIVTADGLDGIAKAQQLRPDMAIIDVMMPQMNGYQVVCDLREDPATADMVLLILTAPAGSRSTETRPWPPAPTITWPSWFHRPSGWKSR